MRNIVTSAEKLWVRTFKTGYKEVTLSQQPFNPAPCGYEDAEFTRTNLFQAAVAAALEAAAGVIKRHKHHWADAVDEIRALITQPQHDFLAAHVAAEVAKARAEDAAWLPITTAPKDGTEFIAHLRFGENSEYAVMLWHDGEEDWTDTFGAIIGYPTHWKPLGSGPNLAQIGAKP